MNDFRKLTIWTRSIDLATKIYKLTSTFPKYEQYGLTSQIRRSIVSISSNIAEGAGRGSNKDFVKFLRISFGSACELETQLIIANNLDYLKPNELHPIISELDEIQKMIFSLEKNKIKE